MATRQQLKAKRPTPKRGRPAKPRSPTARQIEAKTGSLPDTTTGGWEVLWGFLKKEAGGIWETHTTAQREAIYAQHELVYACVREISTSAAQPPYRLWRALANGEKEEVTTHWLLALAQAPNPY